MTPAQFREIALALPETEERSHMDHPDFRVAGKIFATLGYPDRTRGMVKLPPEDQHNFCKDYPAAFVPGKGAWGRRGATFVHLGLVTRKTAGKAIEAAWRNVAPRRLLREPEAVSRRLAGEGGNHEGHKGARREAASRILRVPLCPLWLLNSRGQHETPKLTPNRAAP